MSEIRFKCFKFNLTHYFVFCFFKYADILIYIMNNKNNFNTMLIFRLIENIANVTTLSNFDLRMFSVYVHS